MSVQGNAGAELTAAPHSIERKSFEIISQELGRTLPPLEDPIVKRVIHATADFAFADTLRFSDGAVESGLAALRAGATVITDTNMALAGISKPALAKLGCRAECYMADEDVARAAREAGSTRAAACMEKACSVEGPVIVAVGNAPTALIHLLDLREAGRIDPALIIGAPVGFVNVVESKQRLAESDARCIVAEGRKGGSTVACSIVNALLYMLTRGDAAADGAR